MLHAAFCTIPTYILHIYIYKVVISGFVCLDVLSVTHKPLDRFENSKFSGFFLAKTRGKKTPGKKTRGKARFPSNKLLYHPDLYI